MQRPDESLQDGGYSARFLRVLEIEGRCGECAGFWGENMRSFNACEILSAEGYDPVR